MNQVNQFNLPSDLTNKYHYLNHLGISTHFWDEFVSPTILRLSNHTCKNCGKHKNLTVHHTDYEKQDINHLVVLCKSCHKKAHNNTEKFDEEIIKLNKEGLIDKEIGKKLGIPRLRVLRRRKDLNLKPVCRRSKNV